MNLKNKIRNRELTIGSWLTIPHISVVEIMATAGFDWLVIDIEHTTIHFESLLQLISQIQAHNIQALVRVGRNDELIIKRVLDAGADGIIVPMVKNKQDAKQIVANTYYPPKGNRGVGLYRAQNYGIGFEMYKEKLEKDIVVIAQIEHIDAIHNLEEIHAIPEIDGTIIGPYDLSASMGKPGEFEDPEVQKALQQYEIFCNKEEKPLGAHVISSEATSIKTQIAKGYSFLAFSLDFFFLGDKAREEMKKIKNN